MPLVVYNGRTKWNVPLRLDDDEWMPQELRDLQPRLAGRLVDAKDYAGDDALDGNVARAALALDAASREGLEAALERAVAVLSAVDDQLLWESFEAWCDGILPRLGGQLPTLADNKETTMLAETLREWEEQKIDEGRQEVLCSLAGQRFGAATGDELAALLEGVQDSSELNRIGTLIIDCGSGRDFLARARRR